ncbi:MAG: hypothetical protein KF681_05615 [Bdellovibrionaceae bacterium]|nr:hypothetical protein [Pseudobdellovibrionaceae bacterium]
MAKTTLRSSILLVIGLVALSSFSISCAKKPEADLLLDGNSVYSSGDIVISNSGSRTLLLFDSKGKFKRVLSSLSHTAGEIFTSIVFNRTTKQLVVAVDGTADRLIAIAPDGTQSLYYTDAQFSGTIRGITQLLSGDLLIVETSNVERISSAAIPTRRITVGAQTWPKALQTTGTGIDAMPNGNFVHCSTGSDFVRTYVDNPTGVTQVASAVSGIAGTTDVMDCRSDANNNIYAVFSGTTDTVRKYSTDLTTAVWSYSDLGVLSTPGPMAIRADGRVLVADTAFNHIVEIAADGSSGAVLQGGDIDIDDLLNNPQFIYIIP